MTKYALVTGANRGIGFAIAQGLLTQDYEVIITARSFDRAKQAAEKLVGKVIPIAINFVVIFLLKLQRFTKNEIAYDSFKPTLFIEPICT